jgi:hypothetical protein
VLSKEILASQMGKGLVRRLHLITNHQRQANGNTSTPLFACIHCDEGVVVCLRSNQRVVSNIISEHRRDGPQLHFSEIILGLGVEQSLIGQRRRRMSDIHSTINIQTAMRHSVSHSRELSFAQVTANTEHELQEVVRSVLQIQIIAESSHPLLTVNHDIMLHSPTFAGSQMRRSPFFYDLCALTTGKPKDPQPSMEGCPESLVDSMKELSPLTKKQCLARKQRSSSIASSVSSNSTVLVGSLSLQHMDSLCSSMSFGSELSLRESPSFGSLLSSTDQLEELRLSFDSESMDDGLTF